MYRYLLLVAALCLGGSASAQPRDNIMMEKMTSYEIRDAIADGKPSH